MQANAKPKKSYVLLRWLNLILVVISLLALLGPQINPQETWLLALLSLGTPIFLIVHLLFFLFWLAKKHIYLIFSLGILLWNTPIIMGWYGFHLGNKSKTSKKEIRVVTFNAHMMKQISDGEFVSPEAFARILKATRPDVLFMQEFISNYLKRPAFIKALEEAGLLYYSKKDHNSRLALFSRFPLESLEFKNFSRRTNGYVKAVITLDQQPITLINTHLLSNRVTELTNELATNGGLKNKETWFNVKQVARRYKNAAIQRARQAQEIARAIQNTSGPLIVGGDFNDPAHTFTYRTIKGELQDAFLKRGSSWGATYAGKIPGLRIDYILSSPSLKVKQAYRFTDHYSDHHPVIAVIALP